jgi:heterodisulfide reductase subunit D
VVEENRAPLGILELDNNVTKFSNVYGESHDARFAQLDEVLKHEIPEANIAYYVGCTTAYRHPEIAQATQRVLLALGIKHRFLSGPEGEVCCGSPLMRAGFTKTAKTLAEQNVEAIAQSNSRIVLTTCPGCARVFRQDYPRLDVSLPKKVRVYHITEFLVKYRKQLAPMLSTVSKSVPTNLVYHDPCHLGRELGVYKQPRQLLKLIPNAQLLEFPHHKEYADCCGGGGALPKTFPELTEQITQRRLTDAADTSAEYLLSACPNCKRYFTETLSAQEETLHILDIMEILAKVLKGRKTGR